MAWNFYQSTKLFIHENGSENIVCEMVAILSRGRWVKESWDCHKLCVYILRQQSDADSGYSGGWLGSTDGLVNFPGMIGQALVVGASFEVILTHWDQGGVSKTLMSS